MFVTDLDRKLSLAYVARRDELIRHTMPELFDGSDRPGRGLEEPYPVAGGQLTATDDLARLLERARRGDEPDVRLVGDTTVRGVPVHTIRIEYDVESIVLPADGHVDDPARLPTETLRGARLVHVDRETFLPVRVTELAPAPHNAVMTITDYTEVERLDRTPRTERLLEMSPHPGAEEVVQGA